MKTKLQQIIITLKLSYLRKNKFDFSATGASEGSLGPDLKITIESHFSPPYAGWLKAGESVRVRGAMGKLICLSLPLNCCHRDSSTCCHYGCLICLIWSCLDQFQLQYQSLNQSNQPICCEHHLAACVAQFPRFLNPSSNSTCLNPSNWQKGGESQE